MIEFIESLSAFYWLIPLLVAIVAFLESLAVVGVVVPGVVILTALATTSGQQDISLIAILLAGFIGAWLGDSISFLLGYKFKSTITSWKIFKNSQNLFDRGQKFFDDYGIISIVIGRFVGPIRPIIPILAGILAMHPAKFLTINSISAIFWSPAYILPGYFLGKGLKNIWFPPHSVYVLSYMLATIILAAFCVSYIRKHLTKDSFIYQKLEAKYNDRKFWQRGKNANFAEEFPLAQYLMAGFSLVFFILLYIVKILNFSDISANFNLFLQSQPIWLNLYTQTLIDMFLPTSIAGFFIIWLMFLAWQNQFDSIIKFSILHSLAILAILIFSKILPSNCIDLSLAIYIIFFGSIASFNAQFVNLTKRHIYYISALIILFALSIVKIVVADFSIIEIGITWFISLFNISLINLFFAYTMHQELKFKPAKLGFLIINLAWLGLVILL